jgi:hypothetical protein
MPPHRVRGIGGALQFLCCDPLDVADDLARQDSTGCDLEAGAKLASGDLCPVLGGCAVECVSLVAGELRFGEVADLRDRVAGERGRIAGLDADHAHAKR